MSRLLGSVDIASLVFFRIAFGVIMMCEALKYLSKGWAATVFSPRPIFFTFFGFGWVKPWPGDGMTTHFWVMVLLAFFMAVGFCYRVSAALFFLAFSYVFLLEQAEYLNHFYLICLLGFLMIFVPAHRACSVDAWLRPGLRRQTAPAWAVWLIRGQMGAVYFFGGVAKLNGDWLQGEPMRMWLAARSNYTVVGKYFTQEWATYFFSYGGLLLDLLVVPLLVWRRTRPWAFCATMGFHLSNMGMFSIGIFPWLALAATLMFFEPDWPRRLVNFFRRQPLAPAVTAPPPAGPLGARKKFTLGLIGVYAAWQILMPLRHWLYPGPAEWTEEGHRFSWRMKLRSKSGSVTFTAFSPKENLTVNVDPREMLSARQYYTMGMRPDMIHQFALFLARQFREQGHADVEIRANATVSLNGRKPQLIIDPTVNLAAEPRTLRHAKWILPLTEPLNRDPKARGAINSVE